MAQLPRRIYADTSVFGGCFDKEFEEPSRKLFGRFQAGEDLLILSELILLELQEAPSRVRQLLDTLPPRNVVTVDLTPQAKELAELYIAAGAASRSMLVDAQHIAIATLHRADIVVSWNFRHIVNLQRIRGFNAVNLREGHPLLEIRTPQEVLTYE